MKKGKLKIKLGVRRRWVTRLGMLQAAAESLLPSEAASFRRGRPGRKDHSAASGSVAVRVDHDFQPKQKVDFQPEA